MSSKIRGIQIAGLTLDDSHLSATAGIQTSKLADGANFIKRDGSVSLSAVIAGIDPLLPQHLATKFYVDQMASGLDPKDSVRVASTANLTLSGLQTIDGVSVLSGQRVLVKNQTVPAQNGIYVAAVGSWTRSADTDTGPELSTGAHFFVEEGTTQATSGWCMSTPGEIDLGTTDISFVQFSGSGTYSPGNGLSITGSQFNVVSANAAIASTPGQIQLQLADSTLQITTLGLKLAALATGSILVGNSSSVATAVAISGDATLSTAGALTLSANVVTAAKTARSASGTLLVGQGAAADVAPKSLSGAITMDANGLTTLGANTVQASNMVNNAIGVAQMAQQPAGTLLVGQGGSNLQAVAASGDVSLAQTGAFTIGANVVTAAKTARAASAAIMVGQGAGADIAPKTMSGDMTMDADGVVTAANTFFKTTDCVTNETPAGTVNGVNAVFTLANTPRVLQFVTFNGQILEVGAGNDFTISGATLTLLSPFIPTTSDKVRAFYIK